ncbi:MAG TPA: acyltransferase family protein [Dongiaceae bacterium]|jgi:peptidoglycan/LPS O-acetylase OafA/YrhL|nr:acyltransferase family protein [Dongiaceae bacterium]
MSVGAQSPAQLERLDARDALAPTRADYRTDIDGLRAMAVVPVIILHAGLGSIYGYHLATGGYVGVDVFFVISGFLISRIIYNDIDRGRYSFVDFYTRRIKRIFPALFVVYAFCLLASAMFSVAGEAAEVRTSTLYSIFSVANIYFSTQAGYFDSAMWSNPLLHMWSLSVEEQFYVLFPIIIYCVRHLSKSRRLIVLSVLTVVSLAYSQILTTTNPDVGYYSILSRAWELSIGSILSILPNPNLSRVVREALGWLGVGGIVFAVTGYDNITPFPGLAALVPCLGAAAIIYAGAAGPTFLGSLLSFAPIRFTGLISYSLYLWHWPILVFYRLNFSGKKDLYLVAVLCLLFLISALSWRFVEQPFRQIRRPADRFFFIKGGAAAMAVMSVLAVLTVPVNSMVWNSKADPKAQQLAQFLSYDPSPSMREGTCFLTWKYDSVSIFQPDTCLKIRPDSKNVLILGDSHSAQYWHAFSQTYPEINFLQASSSGCMPIYGAPGETRCLSLFDYVTKDFLPKHHLDAIILAARWKPAWIRDVISTAGQLRTFADKVYIVGPNIEYFVPLPRILLKDEMSGGGYDAQKFVDEDPQRVDDAFKKSLSADAAAPGVTYVSFFDTLCQAGCPVYTRGGAPMLFDNNHLTDEGAGEFAGSIRDIFP